MESYGAQGGESKTQFHNQDQIVEADPIIRSRHGRSSISNFRVIWFTLLGPILIFISVGRSGSDYNISGSVQICIAS